MLVVAGLDGSFLNEAFHSKGAMALVYHVTFNISCDIPRRRESEFHSVFLNTTKYNNNNNSSRKVNTFETESEAQSCSLGHIS